VGTQIDEGGAVTGRRDEWFDRRALDVHGDLLGIVVDVYDDLESRRPAWLAIRTGFFGTRIGVVPLRGASLLGPDVVVAYDRHTVTTAPAVDVVITVDPGQQQRLADHYAQRARPPRPSRRNPEGST
jgi:hypothetical protein